MGNILFQVRRLWQSGLGVIRSLFVKAPVHLNNDYKHILKQYDTLIFDCDGVLYHNQRAIKDSDKFVHEALRQKKQCLFVTNASGNSRSKLFNKLVSMGFNLESNPFTLENMVSSSSAAAEYLKVNYPECKKAYFVGKEGMEEELILHGIKPVGKDDTGNLSNLIEEQFHDKGLDEVGAVVIGHADNEVSYERLAKGAVYARNKDRPFIVTNLDEAWFFDFDGKEVLFPAAGATVNYVSTAAERKPDAIVGKPSAELAKVIKDKFNLHGKRILMIGDRLNTDVAFGKVGGMDTLLVLSGCHTMKHVAAVSVFERPDYIAPKLGAILDCL